MHDDRTPVLVTVPGFSVPTEEKLTTLQPRTGAVYSASLSILETDNVLIVYFCPYQCAILLPRTSHDDPSLTTPISPETSTDCLIATASEQVENE